MPTTAQAAKTLRQPGTRAVLAGKSVSTRVATYAALKRVWMEVNALAIDIPVELITGAKSQSDLVAFYDELAVKNPSLKPGIDALFTKLNGN